MAPQEQSPMCETLVRKITTGEVLSDAEKSHLATCADCLAQVVSTLGESATNRRHGLLMTTAAPNGDLVRSRPEAKKALEKGRQVFEREFGISLSKE
ncbi:MAG: hypothetical protein JO112_00925 [Planctomycetes bacterium]|nr:hypothetical protein [Planctomycetota bacterium]